MENVQRNVDNALGDIDETKNKINVDGSSSEYETMRGMHKKLD